MDEEPCDDGCDESLLLREDGVVTDSQGRWILRAD